MPLSQFFETSGKPKPLTRKVLLVLSACYSFLLVLMCCLPQDVYPKTKEFSTPGILQIGRVYLLPIPLNSLINAGRVESWQDYIWIVLQNLSNVFLLFPLVLAFLFLFEKWQSKKAVLHYTFLMSLGIECLQLLLDLLIDAGRVFEVDDLWTNTLGGLLAYATYRYLQRWLQKGA